MRPSLFLSIYPPARTGRRKESCKASRGASLISTLTQVFTWLCVYHKNLLWYYTLNGRRCVNLTFSSPPPRFAQREGSKSRSKWETRCARAELQLKRAFYNLQRPLAPGRPTMSAMPSDKIIISQPRCSINAICIRLVLICIKCTDNNTYMHILSAPPHRSSALLPHERAP